MRTKLPLVIALSIASLFGVAPAFAQQSQPAANLAVDRYSEMSLSEYQILLMGEASKLSYACRMYRYLYGKWPTSIDEIQGRASGIDFSVFRGGATVTPRDGDDSAEISVFDGENTRSVQATPIDFQLPQTERQAAMAPEYKIIVGKTAVRSH